MGLVDIRSGALRQHETAAGEQDPSLEGGGTCRRCCDEAHTLDR